MEAQGSIFHGSMTHQTTIESTVHHVSWLGVPCRVMIGQYVTVFGDVVSHVNISNVKAEDGGEYECEAVNRAGVAKHQARLNIYGA